MPNSGSVYQRRSDGKWVASLMVNGKRKVAYGGSEREAKKKLAELQGKVAITGTLPNPGRRTVSQLLDFWLETVEPRLKPSTIRDYRYASENYIKPHVGRIRLSLLEPGHLQALYSQLQTKGLKRWALYSHQVLHQALKRAVLWGWLAYNPAERVERPRYRPERKEVWAQEELAIFLEGASEHWLFPLWLLGITTGCRLAELSALRWEDVDSSARTVAIERNLQRLECRWVEGTPKTQAGRRTISLPEEAITILRHQKAQLAERRLQTGSNWQNLGLVFPNMTGGYLNPSMPQHGLKRECIRLGIPVMTPHGLRHLHASFLLASGLPITAVSQRLGHANASITMSVYAHAMKKQDEEAAVAIGKVLARQAAMP